MPEQSLLVEADHALEEYRNLMELSIAVCVKRTSCLFANFTMTFSILSYSAHPFRGDLFLFLIVVALE